VGVFFVVEFLVVFLVVVFLVIVLFLFINCLIILYKNRCFKVICRLMI
jgi:hypothetical protein